MVLAVRVGSCQGFVDVWGGINAMLKRRIFGVMITLIIILVIVISVELFARTPKGVPVKINDARYKIVEIEGMTCISGPASLTCNWDEWGDKRE